MLVLSRKVGESITLGRNIEVTILENHSGEIKLGIKAPKEVLILRTEIIREMELQNKASAHVGSGDVLGGVVDRLKKKSK